ncbi:MAG TPA: signal peptidase I [Flavitalea sp.]|nr:signal peptidase I [Flavitalea sp.]
MRTRFVILFFLLPGFGYLRLGQTKSFYASIILLYSIIFCGSLFKLFPAFAGFVSIAFFISVLHFGTAFHAILKRKELKGSQNHSGLKIAITGILLLVTVTCFGNSATIMGFDRVSMAVPVMEPTIRTGEQLLVDTWIYSSKQPRREDIILHRFAGQKGAYLNRIIGTPGDIVEIRNGTLYINGKSQIEDYVLPANAERAESRQLQRIKVPSNSYFVMGDNRDKSFGDSRFSGMVKLDDIKGKITCILYSTEMSRIGKYQ